MPTMTNPETGETKEISMEEFMEAMRGGKISVRQEVHHADGSVTSSVIYGNDVGDGIDRSVNIFGTMNDVLKPAVVSARKILEADKDAKKIFFMDNTGADYEVTIDDTEKPFMHIVTCTKETVHVARYIRDERKSVGKPIAENTYTFTDGKLSASLEESREGNALILFAFGVYEIRRILEECGVLQELQRLDNRGTGVMITVNDDNDDEIVTKVVRGRNRPDLPCLMFGGLFAQSVEDAVMMRPYMDELMGDTLRAGMTEENMLAEAGAGDPDAMEQLARAYLDGDGVEQDFDKCAYWWKKLAETGNAVGMFNIGLHYAKGCGVERSFETAAKWMERAAEAGDEDAPAIAEKYRSVAELQRKAEAGDAQAMAELAGILMSMGGSLEQAGPGNDYEESITWAQKAVDAGCAAGYWPLALAYEHGRGVEQNTAKAVELYKKGAELGNAACQHSYACYIIRGDIEGDKKRAFELLQESADQGYALAYRTLGYMYEVGDYVEPDMDKELAYFEKACLADPSDAEFVRHVAFQYENGDGSDAIDLERAIHWFKVAADGGDMLAMHEYQRLTAEPAAAVPQKTPEELAAEKAQAEEAARRKAEEEEARRKAEADAAEKLRQDKAEYEKARREWQAECQRVEGQRQSLVAEQQSKRRNELKAAAEKACADKLAALDETEKKLKAELAETESALASLGFFKFGEKKAAKEKIERLTSELSKAEADRGAAEEAKNAAIAAIDRTLSSEKAAMTRLAESAYPLPKEPQKPASILKDEAEKEKARFAGMTPLQQKNEMLKDAIVAYLKDSEPMTISDMIECIPELEGESNQSVSALCRALTLSGKIDKFIDKRRTYFRAF